MGKSASASPHIRGCCCMADLAKMPGALILLMSALMLPRPALCQASASNEPGAVQLLSGVNAYNPVPSPDGKMIAFVKTGWGRGSITGFGRASLISDVMVMQSSGKAVSSKPLADAFLQGWTPDGKKLVCYRDWKAFLVGLNGTKSDLVDVPQSQVTERAEYFAIRHAFCWNWQRKPQLEESEVECSDGSVLARKDSFFTDLIVPSPDERYLAVLGASEQLGSAAGNNLWVYDRSKRSWTNLGKSIISPDPHWDYIKPSWNPWFADSSRLAYVTKSGVVVATPDGRQEHLIARPGRVAGLAVPSPDGKQVAYVTFVSRPTKIRRDVAFWGNTTVWVTSVNGETNPRPVTPQAPDTTCTMHWVNNSELVFDRITDEMFYRRARIWIAEVPAN